MTYTLVMSNANATVAAPTPPETPARTEDQILREISVLKTQLLDLQFELKRLRNPTGKTLADVRGIWAGQESTQAEIDEMKFRFPDEPTDSEAEGLGRCST